MPLRLVQFLAIVLTALALAPAGAHFFALQNKVGLPAEAYFIVQGIYRGWALFGFIWISALVANAAVAFLVRDQRWPCRLALVAALSFVVTLIIFFAWTYPANQATSNWTNVPANWEALRDQWEYSHAVNAVIAFNALCAATLSALMTRI